MRGTKLLIIGATRLAHNRCFQPFEAEKASKLDTHMVAWQTIQLYIISYIYQSMTCQRAIVASSIRGTRERRRVLDVCIPASMIEAHMIGDRVCWASWSSYLIAGGLWIIEAANKAD